MWLLRAARSSAFIICAAMTVGCATSGQAPDPALSGYGNYAYPMYADLEQTNGGWRFVNLSPDQDDRDVRLNDLRYLGNKDAGDRGCVRGFFGATEGNCDRNNDDLEFQTSDFTATDYILSGIMMPLTQPIALLLSPFIIASDTETADMVVLPVYGPTGFDEQGYWAAIGTARDTNQFHDRFPRIHREFIALYEAMELYRPPVMRTTNAAEVKEEGLSWHEDYWQHLTRDLMENLPLKVEDHSGLAPDELRSVGLTAVKVDTTLSARQENFVESLEQVEAPRMRRPNWLNNLAFNDIDHMENMIRFQRNRFDQVNEENERRVEKAHELIPELDEANSDRLNRFIEAILTARLDAHVEPSDSFIERWASFDKEFEIAEDIGVNGTGEVEGSGITLLIQAVNFEHRFAPGLNGSNDHLALSVDDETLTLENVSDQYVTLDRVSFYYRHHVLTLSGDEAGELEELPPGVSRSRDIGDLFALEDLDTAHSAVTRENAADTEFRYGFAFRYQVTGSATPQAMTQIIRPSLLELMDANGVIDSL